MATSIHQDQLQDIFKEHWHDEQDHLERIAERIKQLGGVPNLDPEDITSRASRSSRVDTRWPICCAKISSRSES
jgi:bacterioferritin (cytochrome b1)